MGGGVHKKGIQTHCKHSPFPSSRNPSPHEIVRKNEETRRPTFSKAGSPTTQNHRETVPKPDPHSRTDKGTPPQKTKFSKKNRLRWTASPFSVVARKVRKLKIVPPNRRHFFVYLEFSKKIGNSKKHVLTTIPLAMSCGILYLQNEVPHHQPLGWKAPISINLGDGILVQDCRRQHQEPQQVFKITAPNQ